MRAPHPDAQRTRRPGIRHIGDPTGFARPILIATPTERCPLLQQTARAGINRCENLRAASHL
eukprot:5326547-Prymnesium_polylepis.1